MAGAQQESLPERLSRLQQEEARRAKLCLEDVMLELSHAETHCKRRRQLIAILRKHIALIEADMFLDNPFGRF